MDGHGQYSINAQEKTEKAEAAWATRLFQGKRKEKVKADHRDKVWKIKKDRRMCPFTVDAVKLMPLSINLKDSPYGKVASSVQPEAAFQSVVRTRSFCLRASCKSPSAGHFGRSPEFVIQHISLSGNMINDKPSLCQPLFGKLLPRKNVADRPLT